MAQDPNSGENTDGGGFDWSKLIGPGVAAGVGLIGRAALPSPQQATQQAMPPELRQLLAMSAQRAQYQQPLFQAISNQAFAGLPSYAKQGLAMPSGMPSASGPGDPSGGGIPDWLKVLLGGLAGSQARSMLPGAGKNGAGGDLGKLLQSIFGHHGNFGHGLGAVGDPGSGPAGSFLPSYDPFAADPFSGMPNGPMGLPSDPSGGSGIGPGMQDFYSGGGAPGGSNGQDDDWGI